MGELTIHYEGYWQCRQATDPDPSRAPRGSSGYVFGTGWESEANQPGGNRDPKHDRVLTSCLF